MSAKNQKKKQKGDLRTSIWTTLQKLKTPSAFAFSAVEWSLPNPGICIPPHGVLGLPLSNDAAQKIISLASQSPFGKGAETIVDTSVRKSFELNPNQFSLKNPDWSKVISKILDSVIIGLGLNKAMGKVSAELYKLLLYEPGAFFKQHKDSEKAPGMFATLVVCLPSAHEGGKLILTQDNETYEFDTAGSSAFRTSYAAWYADISHEVLPITSGYRLVLTYNLIRNTDFEIPSFNLVRGCVQKLSTLLELYNSQLEAGAKDLPPILLHKLKHKYTQANLQLKMLKPADLAQVSTLAQLATKLGFYVFLATLELEVNTDEEFEDDDDGDVEKEQRIQNIVELDGKIIAEDFAYPEGALIDPTPQDAGEADEEKREGYTGNEGCPVTLWYRDTVVVIVPSSKRFDFVFKFNSKGAVIVPLFCKLMQEFSEDPTQKPRLMELCELALKQYIGSYPIPRFFQKAADTALDLGRFDLFDKACKKTSNKIMLNTARMLGRWAANNGLATMSDRLMKGVKAAFTVAGKVEFLKSLTDGFKAAMQEGSVELANLKQWSDEAILTSVAELMILTEGDAVSLAQLCTTMDWSLYESKVTPVVLKVPTIVKISFINELLLTLPQDLVTQQRSFIKTIILDIWNKFTFDCNENNLLRIIQISVTILSCECVETTIIPAMLDAIPETSKECTKKLSIPIVRTILKNELAGFELSTDDAVPPPSRKRLVQALLIKYIKENVGLEPQAPKNWSLPTRSCNCKDCSLVNKFLQDPVQKIFKLPCSKPRRYHLHQIFTDWGKERFFDVETLRDHNPNVWQITKHRRGYESSKADRVRSTAAAKQLLLELKNEEPVTGRLESYLQPHCQVIMNANVNKLPDLMSLISTSQESEMSENEGSILNQTTNQTGRKRGASEVDPVTKRTRTN